MKKVYTLGLALFVGVAVMAADNGPHAGRDNRSVKENSTVRTNTTTVQSRNNGKAKVIEQDKHYSSRYGNDSWGNRNERNDNWAYANDRYYRDYDHENRGYDRDDDHNDRSLNHNDRSYERNDHSYGNSKIIQRRF